MNDTMRMFATEAILIKYKLVYRRADNPEEFEGSDSAIMYRMTVNRPQLRRLFKTGYHRVLQMMGMLLCHRGRDALVLRGGVWIGVLLVPYGEPEDGIYEIAVTEDSPNL